jgi:FixJ family two-component response regulator
MEKLKVVVLDDDTYMVDALSKSLINFGIDAVGYSDPVEALHFIEVSDVDALITDVNMPLICGKSVCSILRASPHGKTLPIILISGDPSIGDYSLYFKGVDFMQKPCDIVRLIRKIYMYSSIEKAEKCVDSMLKGKCK